MKIYNLLILLIFTILISCSSSTPKQTFTSGSIKILVDESFAPIIESEAYVFENTYANAKLNLIYKPENELVNLFINDSIPMAILSRELTKEESKFYENKKIKVRVNRFAIDAIALITHQSNPNSTITVSAILDILRGKGDKSKTLVFDHQNSSTLQYFMNLAGIKKLPLNGVYALKSNPDVINYVYTHPDVIGVVGVNWMEQPNGNLELIISKLKILGVKNIAGKLGDDGYYMPSQNDIALGLYPFTRSLYSIDCQGGPGLGAGFASFLAGERGQRIILKSGLLPIHIPSREVIIKN